MRSVPKPLPDADFLRSILDYSPETGIFTWIYRTDVHIGVNTRLAGVAAGRINGNGYITIGINGISYQAHRLAWRLMTGRDPASDIDHADCKKTNNSFANLRETTIYQNQANTRKRITNTSGHKGVCWNKLRKKWMAQIKIDGKNTYIGLFDNIEAAAEAYKRAAIDRFGEFARTA